jgi:hypothetical protein
MIGMEKMSRFDELVYRWAGAILGAGAGWVLLAVLYFVLPESGRSPDERAGKAMFFGFVLFLPVTISGAITGYVFASRQLKKWRQAPRGFAVEPTADPPARESVKE